MILVYYYLLNSPEATKKLRSYVPTTADAHMNEVLGSDDSGYELTKVDEESVEKDSNSVGKRIKVKLSDIDMSSLNTDLFSKKIDSFLDEKSDELIKDWCLATTDDLESIL